MNQIPQHEFELLSEDILSRLKEVEEPLIVILKDAAELIYQGSLVVELERHLKKFEVQVKELHAEFLLKQEHKLQDTLISNTNNSTYSRADVLGAFLTKDKIAKNVEDFLTKPTKIETQIPFDIRICRAISKQPKSRNETDIQILESDLGKAVLNFLEPFKLDPKIFKSLELGDNIRLYANTAETNQMWDLLVAELEN